MNMDVKTMVLKHLENKLFGENLTFGGEIGVSMTTWPVTTLQKHNNKNLKQIFPEKKLRDLSPNFHSHVVGDGHCLGGVP